MYTYIIASFFSKISPFFSISQHFSISLIHCLRICLDVSMVHIYAAGYHVGFPPPPSYILL